MPAGKYVNKTLNAHITFLIRATPSTTLAGVPLREQQSEQQSQTRFSVVVITTITILGLHYCFGGLSKGEKIARKPLMGNQIIALIPEAFMHTSSAKTLHIWSFQRALGFILPPVARVTEMSSVLISSHRQVYQGEEGKETLIFLTEVLRSQTTSKNKNTHFPPESCYSI